MTLNSHNRISIDSHIYEQDSVTEFLTQETFFLFLLSFWKILSGWKNAAVTDL